MDAIVTFNPLPEEIILKIVDKFIKELNEQLAPKNITIKLTEKAKKWIASKGFDSKFGARPLQRVIQRQRP